MSQTKKQIESWILPWLSRALDVSITFFTVVFSAQLVYDIYFKILSFFLFLFSDQSTFYAVLATATGLPLLLRLEPRPILAEAFFFLSLLSHSPSRVFLVGWMVRKWYYSFIIFPTLKHAYPDRCKVPVFIINICLFLGTFFIQKDVHSHKCSLDSGCHP